MNTSLPESASLEHLKSQAKSLLQSLRSGEPDALARVADLPVHAPYRLAHAQLAVAREYGFDSWAKLKRHLTTYPEKRDAFFAAIRAGDRDRTRDLLDQDRALVRSLDPSEFGSTSLTAAARRDDLKMLELLLDYGADVDQRSDWWAGGFGPLDFSDDSASDYLLSRGATLTAHAAARLGRAADLREIVERDPASVHERGGDGQMPLHFARTPEIVDILLDAGADIDARDIDHEGTPLQYRILVEPVAKRLLERGATPDVFSATVLEETTILATLLDADPGALTRRTTDAGNPWIPQPQGGPIYLYTIGSKQPHQVATDFKRDAVYQLLWERSSPALRLAMAGWRADVDAARRVLSEDPGVIGKLTAAEMQVLPDAGDARRTDTVRLLLEVGFDPNVQNPDQFTAISRAAFHGFDDVVEVILRYRPDLTLKNRYGGTPLGTCMYGSVHGWRTDGNHARCVELLIEAGSPLPNSQGGNPAVMAVLERHGVPKAS